MGNTIFIKKNDDLPSRYTEHHVWAAEIQNICCDE